VKYKFDLKSAVEAVQQQVQAMRESSKPEAVDPCPGCGDEAGPCPDCACVRTDDDPRTMW